MLDESGEHLHQPQLECPLAFGDVVPSRHGGGSRGQLGVGRDPAPLLLAGEHALAHSVPAVVEPALVLVRPPLGDMVRPVRGPGRPVEEERLVRREGSMLAQPGRAWSARSSDRWYFGSCGGSIGLVFSKSRGSHCEVSPAMKP